MDEDILDSVFRAYDIRGMYPDQIDDQFAFELGLAFSKYFLPEDVFVVRDTRDSGESLKKLLMKGIVQTGRDVVDGGVMSTPQAYHAMQETDYDAGIIITASHNPEGYNGFKLMREDGEPVSGEKGGKAIKNIMKEKTFTYHDEEGEIIEENNDDEYKSFLEGIFRKVEGLEMVVDKSNGSAHTEIQFLKDRFPRLTVLNEEENGFNHEPDPTSKESKETLRKAIDEEDAELGVLFDGDGDRTIFIDEEGEEIRPDIAACIFMDYLSGDTIVQDPRSTKYLEEKAEETGKSVVMSKAGRTNMIEHMMENEASFGVEGSGHYFYESFGYLDCPMMALRDLLLAYEDEERFSDLRKKNTKYFHSGEHNFEVNDSQAGLETVRNEYNDAQKMLFIDGISVYEDDYWFNIRESNTQPLLRVNLEADDKETMDEKLRDISELLS